MILAIIISSVLWVATLIVMRRILNKCSKRLRMLREDLEVIRDREEGLCAHNVDLMNLNTKLHHIVELAEVRAENALLDIKTFRDEVDS